MRKLSRFIEKEGILFTFLLLLVILTILYPGEIKNYPSFIDWQTIKALTGLLIITTGFKESKYFFIFSKRILKKLESERKLSIFLILLSATLSTFLTNDVTLFVVIPLTMSIQKVIKNDISKLIIFEAISVNVGSSLTPIGNPQNLFLWNSWGISFATFVLKMFPLFILLFVVLLAMTFLFIPDRKIKFSEHNDDEYGKRMLFNLSLIFMIFYVIFLEIKQVDVALAIVIITYIIFYRKVILRTDWLLLILFSIIFIDFRVISNMPAISTAVQTLNLHSSTSTFLFSALISQLISNVPAAVLISSFSHNWMAIAYGVNVGGNGLIIASLANIIALRIGKNRKLWIDFHKYSLIYFFITLILAYILFYL